MSYDYDYFVSYAPKDNEDGFVEKFVERLANSSDFEKLLGAKPRVFFDAEAVRAEDDWESATRAGLEASRSLILLLSPNYFQSELCALEFREWLESEKRRSLPDGEFAPIQIADVPGLRADGQVDVPQDLKGRFPNWVSELRKHSFSDDFDLRARSTESIDTALAALYRVGRAAAANNAAGVPDDLET